jgi:hypothetical protein
MGVVDIRNALNEAAGDQFRFREVKLRYSQGGSKQVLSFKISYRDNSVGVNETQEIEFSGQDNPIDKAIEIAVSYKDRLKGE